MARMQYEIRIRGRVGDAMLRSIGDLETEVEPADTILRGPVQDATALRDVLRRIQAMDLDLLEVKRLRP
jgi:hypothetical protein